MTDETKPPGGLSWADAYARLERLARAMEAEGALAGKAAAQVLEERARQLAQPPAAPEPRGACLDVVRFHDGGQAYALESRLVHEVLRTPALTPLPRAPPLLRGLMLLRGEVLPVVELAPLFGRAATGARALVLVVGGGRPELGLCADAVEEVSLLKRTTLMPPPPSLAEGRELVSGIDSDGLVLLEGSALLGDSRLVFDLGGERDT
ncbi:chemotaxis protein CheW [Myxococcaceae bacterium GXIMD 01537]